jgi:hypothetical protein
MDWGIFGLTVIAMLVTAAIAGLALGWLYVCTSGLGEGPLGWGVAVGGLFVGGTFGIAWAESHR